MTNFIVFAAVGILAGMTGMWLFRRDLRAWMEEPKHRFLEQAIRYDEAREGRK